MSTEFARLVADGQATGEVVAVRRFVVKVSGLDSPTSGALVVFETGDIGVVRETREDLAVVLTLSSEGVPIGCLGVVKSNELMIPVGEKFMGRIVNPLMHPLDNKGAILARETRPLFAEAPGFADRAVLNEQLETGISIVDTLFPVVLGQRIAIMGDAKSGKTTFLTQAAINQARAGRRVVYVAIAKRRTDIEQLIARLDAAKVRDNFILVVADVFDSIMLQYLAPYAGCALGEALWYGGEDVVVIYDDFSSHAKVYREISLLVGTNPGRESFPGDMFYRHSSLLERAGKLSSNNKTLTALPIAVTPNDDIAGYLSTSLISMTDGQIVFDVETMYRGVRPAVNVGLSVSRVGGRAQSHDYKALAGRVSQLLSRSRQAEQFSHFGTELSSEMQSDLYVSTLIKSLFNQAPDELFTTYQQQVMLHATFLARDHPDFSVAWMKSVIAEVSHGAKDTSPEDLARHILSSSPSVKPEGVEK